MSVIPINALAASNGYTKCYACVSEHKLYVIKKENGTIPEGAVEPDVLEADTWVPIWQQKQVGPQMVMACVTVPICEEKHLQVSEMSALDKAMMGGKILPGSLG